MKTVFMDIDGCILDQSGECNASIEELVRKIKEEEEKGFIFGLNSNRGEEDLKIIQKMLDLEGPLIVENGAAILFREKYEYAQHLKAPENYIPIVISNLKKTSEYKSGIFYDSRRAYTFSIYCINKGKPDLKTAVNVKKELEKIYPRHKVWIKPNKGHIWCIDPNVNKGTAISEFIKIYNARVAMIGHDHADIPALAKAHMSAVPANCSGGISAHYKSRLSYTKGVIDCITNICKQL